MKEILLNKKNQKVFGIAIISTILFLSGLSYAYFIGSVGGSASTDVDVTTSVNERLVFTEGNPIAINATLDNFSDGDGSLTGETTTNVRLNAGSQSSTATEQYQVYYLIETNTFEYSVNTDNPELILTITNPEGDVLTTAKLEDGSTISTKSVVTLVQDGLGGTTSETITGFDITDYEGFINLAEDYTITNTNPTIATEQNWTAKITFINLDAEQTVNEGKTLNSNFMLTEDGLPLTYSILKNNGGISSIESKSTPNFANFATTNEGMFAAADDYGTSYYFRGAVDNNWLHFAGFYWRIVRINGDGSVRLIYSGETAPTELQKVVMTGAGTEIGASIFNSATSRAEDAGYMYTIGEQHGTSLDSTVKTAVDTWYENNVLNTANHLKVADNTFCVDRSAFTSTAGSTIASGVGTSIQYFGSYVRNITKHTPSLECPNQEDMFTTSTAIQGNGFFNYPVGLLSADEAQLAGITETNNSSNYLYTSRTYWLISPYEKGLTSTHAFYLTTTATLYVHQNLGYSRGVRPTLSLDANIFATGTGTWNDPYIVL